MSREEIGSVVASLLGCGEEVCVTVVKAVKAEYTENDRYEYVATELHVRHVPIANIPIVINRQYVDDDSDIVSVCEVDKYLR